MDFSIHTDPVEKMRTIISPDTKRSNRIPPGQHLADNWPVLHHGRIPRLDTKWTFRIFGLVDREVVLTKKDFFQLPRTRVFSDIHCVTTWSLLDNYWEGVSSLTIKDLVKISTKAKYAMIHAHENFTTNIPLVDLFQEDVLMAFSHNGKALNAPHGAPVRLVVPRLYFWKSAKWVTGIEFMEKDRAGFWERNGYHMHGDPWKEERYW